MNDLPPAEIAPATATAGVTPRRRLSLAWIIPIVTLLAGGYLAYDTISKRGPTITITFAAGEGLVAGQSQIKDKDIVLGTVTNVVLSADLNHVVVTAAMKREAEPLLTDQARFWVVKPQLFAGTLRGLDTLLSGSYIALLPSREGNTRARSFTGLEDPPVLTTDLPGTTFSLQAKKLGAISLGSPVFYRDLSVGEVLGWDLGDMAETVTLHVFVRAPFDHYVREKSRFWNASGLNVKLGAEGVQIQVDSLKALLLGGVAFDTPLAARDGPKVAANEVFPLFENLAAANDADFTRRVPMLAYFPGAVDGLAVGAPVTFKGLRIGEVTGIAIRYDKALDMVVVPVTFSVEPDRIGNSLDMASRGPLVNLTELVKRGMRAELKSTNLITGQQAVSLEMDADAPPATLRVEDGVFVIPTTGGGLAGVMNSVNQLLTKVNSMPFSQIGTSLAGTLSGAESLTTGPEIRTALRDLTGTLASLQEVAKRLDTGVTPVMRRLPDIATLLQGTLSQASKLISGMDTGYAAGSPVNRDLTRILVEFSDAARSVRVLADLLTRHPEALVRGRTGVGPE